MDNKKGKKGKLLFSKYFLIINDNEYFKIIKIVKTELVTDNVEGKKGK
jgi:hypothetical protein